LAINQSDIAASGGTPRFALVSLGLPSDLEVSFVDRLYAGMLEQAERFETAIVGGNISQSRLGIFIDVSLLGQAERANVVLRSGAAPGDQILVTGTLGDAAAALALTQKRVTASESYSRVARSRADTPTPRVREGQIIGASHLATAMLDVSDGLVGDLRHICESSGVGAQIDAGRLPVSAENRALGRTLFNDEWHFALFGGEDYELLFTAPPEKADDLARMVSDRTGTPVAVIGKVLETPNRQELTLGDGTSVQLPSQGWDHFRS
jgi:thiamine-monophosphate kinase